jgi:hypothetical protein
MALSALVFWSNRLDFVADMDVIVNFLPGSEMWYSHSQSEDDSTAKLWKKVRIDPNIVFYRKE